MPTNIWLVRRYAHHNVISFSLTSKYGETNLQILPDTHGNISWLPVEISDRKIQPEPTASRNLFHPKWNATIWQSVLPRNYRTVAELHI